MKKEAKKSFAKFVNSLFAFVLVVGLMPTWTLSNPTPAFAAPNDVTVTTTVNGLASDTLPVLSSAAGDFTVGQAVNADPVNYTDANGNTPVANLAKQQAEKGLSLKWVDAETGADFDWNSTKVNRSTVVNGIWTQTQCSVTVSANDGGKTADTVVTVPWGKSYASVEGSAPQAPSRDGWQFLGWYTKDEQQYNFNSAVKEPVVVEAKWAVADVTIVPTTNPTSDIPQSLSGTVWIGATWSIHPAQFALSNFSGYLSGCAVTGYCADRSAAQPTNVRANYTATLNSVNVETGEVVYDVYITPPGVTDGHSRNQFGLTGYQHVSAQVKLIKNFGGWVEINKSSANTDITDGNGCYSLEGAEYVVYNSDNQAVDKAACGLGSGDVSAIEIDGKAFGEGHEVKLVAGKYEWSDDNGSGQYLEKTDDGWKLVEFSDSADMSNSKEIGTYTDDQVKLTKDTPVLPLSPDYEAIAKVMQENPDIVSCLSIEKKTFTPEEQSGTVSMDFPINSIYNEDTDTVVFEFLFKGSELIANESDLGNEGQTVSIVTPKLSTTATDKTDGDHTLLPSREATVVDHVEYTDLIPGKEYTVSGTLMDKSTGEPLVVGDGNVTAETTFVPNKADGTVDLEFTFDASELGGKDLVAFEIAYKDGIQIADHQDIDDEAQTVTVSEPDDNTFDAPGGDG